MAGFGCSNCSRQDKKAQIYICFSEANHRVGIGCELAQDSRGYFYEAYPENPFPPQITTQTPYLMNLGRRVAFCWRCLIISNALLTWTLLSSGHGTDCIHSNELVAPHRGKGSSLRRTLGKDASFQSQLAF